ncbi:hypothetical protein J2S09_002307 [Bacillus fengqiuensis]|nr:hypothetical protein [Bacillus fengqiuensis]
MEVSMNTTPNNKALFSIWRRPSETMKGALGHHPTSFLILIAWLAGLSNLIDFAVSRNVGDRVAYSSILIIIFTVGPVFGLLQWIVSSYLYTLVGKWFGGTGEWREMRVAYGYANIPIAWGMILQIIQLFLFQDGFFQSSPIYPSAFYGIMMILFGLIDLVLMGWFLVILVKGVSIAHEYSWKKALGTIVISTLLIFMLIFLFFFLFIFIAG